ncbi:MAG TPA: amino acid adenylation domain-containing protein, partial [Longimicrobium sp.]
LGMQDGGERIGGSLAFRTDLFDGETVARMAEHLRRVLEQVAADADLRLSALDLLGEDERRQVLADWNPAPAAYPADSSIPALFEAQAARAPEGIALVFGGERTAYGELNARANRLAHRLTALGVGPETRVAICLERGAQMVTAALAVLKAGGAYVPLEPGYPAERLALMLADSAVPVLVTEAALADGIPAREGLRVVRVDADAAEIDAESAENPAGRAGPRSLAYVIYTSGSTGTPKGVAVEHRGVIRLVRDTDYVRLDETDRIAHASSVSFDAATFEVWGALLNGGAVVGIPKETAVVPAALVEALRAGGVTTFFLTTALFNQVARERPEGFNGLRYLCFGGEAVDPAAVRRVLDAGGPAHLLHVYGPTENTTFSTWHRVRGVAPDARTVPLGRAVAHSTAYVLDARLALQPTGVPGELYLGGDGLARGYLGRPAATAERFVPDPFAAVPGARMYRTGDRVRWTADGALEYLARLDGQVKVRGFRIELGEVENAIRRYEGMVDCAVVAREEGPGDRRLAAYVVGDVDVDALRAHLRRGLPEYMVPASIRVLDALPLNANGKLDRRALPAPDYAAADDRYVAPRTQVEEVLAGIWMQVLRLERVGVRESFFEVGGHSLLATRVVSRVREVFGVELPLRALFEGPTLAELAERVEALRAADRPQLPPIVPVERGRPLPLSFAQERLWFLDRLEEGSTFYNVQTALRLHGAMDAAALERALGEIVRRHDSLRTTFVEMNGAPVQLVEDFRGFSLPIDDLSMLDAGAREAEVRRRADADARTPFDLAMGPLFRAALLRLSDEEHVLMIAMHHVVSDGWSMGVLFRELTALYETYRNGGESPLPELPVQYADFAAWQREQLRGEVLDAQLAWWRERLAGAPPLLELPTDRPRPAAQSHRGSTETLVLPAALVERLEALARKEGATLYMVLLAAFQTLLGRYAGTDDVVVGSPIAGRTRREVEELIGFFVNTLVMRTDLGGDPAFREVLRRVRETTLGAFEHQEVPFERLVDELQPERSLAWSPLVQVTFLLQNMDTSVGGMPGVAAQAVGVELQNAKYDLSLAFGAAAGGGLVGALEYATDLFDGATVTRMLGHLRRILEQAAENADTRISRMELVDAGERRLLTEEWNATGAAYPASACIHQLFQAQVARTPNAAAVRFGDESLTFREVDERANQLAHHLRRLGVGPEVRVGLCVERGLEVMPAILGVLKAGGAYVPVDPGHPVERIRYVLEDSDVAVLLTQSSLVDRIPVGVGVRRVCVDTAWPLVAADRGAPPESGVTSENLCYVIYTSGSTGRPKGVAMHHRGVVNYIHWGIPGYGANTGNGAPVFSSMAVDLTITNLLPLFAGKPVRFLPEENAVEALAEALREGPGYGLIKITPTHLTLLTPMLTPEEARAAAVTLVVGADFLPAEPTVWWQENAPGVRLMNEYGPTETVVGCSAYTLPNGVHRQGPVPVGGPIDNLTFFVLDEHLHPVPVGLPGELYIGGAGVARGYLGRPGLSAEKFVPDPFGPPGARMYRTGDRARWLGGGNLLILGRTDNQVKLRGYRVELGEVESALRDLPGVRDAAAVVRE